MCYFKFTADTPYWGTENTAYSQFEKRPTDAELDKMAEEYRQRNAGSYEYLATDNFKDTVVLEMYYAKCTGTWEEITEEEYIFRGHLTN